MASGMSAFATASSVVQRAPGLPLDAHSSHRSGFVNAPIARPYASRNSRSSRLPPQPRRGRCGYLQPRRVSPSATAATAAASRSTITRLPERDVAVLLLAGGVGSRMKADRPKQFLSLAGRTVLEHSLELFCSMPEVLRVVVVVDDEFRDDVAASAEPLARAGGCELCFAAPGKERQDSVRSGLARAMQLDPRPELVCVHDSARPLVTAESVRNVLSDARRYGAAVLGVPSKATIKESADGEFVLRTIERSRLWEIQTPQVIRPEVLQRGFDKVLQEGLAVTDDGSIVEQLGEPVKITVGEYTNIKITTPEDLDIARSILSQRTVTVS